MARRVITVVARRSSTVRFSRLLGSPPPRVTETAGPTWQRRVRDLEY